MEVLFQEYLSKLQAKVTSDSLHAAVLKEYKEYLMSGAETRSFFGTLYLKMPISLQVALSLSYSLYGPSL